MKNIVSVFVFCLIATASFAQQNFVHIDNYTWIDNDGVKMVNLIDQAVDGKADVAIKKELAKSIRHCAIRFRSLDNLLLRTEEQKTRRSARYANYQEYVDIHREDPNWKEISVNTTSSDRLQLTCVRMDEISRTFRQNKNDIIVGDTNYEANKALLAEFKELYLECADMLKASTLN